jgi:ankyrin repeat protein
VKALLDSDPLLLTIRDEQGVSAILTAIYYGRENVLRELLDHKPTLDIWEASAAGQLARVNEILDQDRPAQPSLTGWLQCTGFGCVFWENGYIGGTHP